MGAAEAKVTAEPTAPDTAKADGKSGKKGEVKERQVSVRERGTKWSLERCRKYARRYQSEAEWMKASPASYKAASYWGWVEQCCEQWPKNLRLVHSVRSTQPVQSVETVQSAEKKKATSTGGALKAVAGAKSSQSPRKRAAGSR